MSKGVHNIVFYVSPDPECSRTTQNSEISIAPSRGCILYAIYGNSTCVISHIVVTAIDKKYCNYYISTTVVVVVGWLWSRCADGGCRAVVVVVMGWLLSLWRSWWWSWVVIVVMVVVIMVMVVVV